MRSDEKVMRGAAKDMRGDERVIRGIGNRTDMFVVERERGVLRSGTEPNVYYVDCCKRYRGVFC